MAGRHNRSPKQLCARGRLLPIRVRSSHEKLNREEQDAHILRGVVKRRCLVRNAPVANRSKGIGDTIVQWRYRCTCRILNCVSVPTSKQELAVRQQYIVYHSVESASDVLR